jgi:hypothetical protein
MYFLLRSGLVTDYTEPQNLFALAVNSPPSDRLAGSCGAGPEGEMLIVDWYVKQEEDTNHFYIKEGKRGMGAAEFELRRRNTKERLSPAQKSGYSKLSNQRSSWL